MTCGMSLNEETRFVDPGDEDESKNSNVSEEGVENEIHVISSSVEIVRHGKEKV